MNDPSSDLTQPADVLVVGGGPAGAALAARLSEDPNRRMLFREAGPAANAQRTHALRHRPIRHSDMLLAVPDKEG